VEALERSFLSTLPTEVVAPMLADGRELAMPARAVVAPSAHRVGAALLLDGLARLFVRAPGGREATVGYRRQGNFFLHLNHSPQPFHIQALTSCRGWLIPQASFERALKGDPRFGAAVAQHAGARLHATVKELRFGLFATVRQRMARHLLELASVAPEGALVAPVTVQELADAVGSVREVVSREIRDLVQLGVITRLANGYGLPRPERLRAEFADMLDRP
jgi:CRP/FNR family transcriptional regulator